MEDYIVYDNGYKYSVVQGYALDEQYDSDNEDNNLLRDAYDNQNYDEVKRLLEYLDEDDNCIELGYTTISNLICSSLNNNDIFFKLFLDYIINNKIKLVSDKKIINKLLLVSDSKNLGKENLIISFNKYYSIKFLFYHLHSEKRHIHKNKITLQFNKYYSKKFLFDSIYFSRNRLISEELEYFINEMF